MPVHIERRPVKSGRNYAIVERSGRVVGRSKTRKNADASARARNANSGGRTWKPKKRRRRRKPTRRRRLRK